MRRCLDIDAAEEWGPIYEPWFAALAPAAVWKHLFDPDAYGSSEGRVRALALAIAPPRRWKYNWLRAQATEFLKANFTDVACYHSCRVVDAENYLTNGVLKADLDLLDREAEMLFGKSPELQKAILAARHNGYRAHNHGGAYVFAARSGALYDGDHYRRHGSEYLGRLAGALGPDPMKVLESRGRPAIIKCMIPVAELSASDARFMAIQPIYHKLTVRDPEAPARIYAVPGGFKHAHGIPANRIAIEYVEVEPPSA